MIWSAGQIIIEFLKVKLPLFGRMMEKVNERKKRKEQQARLKTKFLALDEIIAKAILKTMGSILTQVKREDILEKEYCVYPDLIIKSSFSCGGEIVTSIFLVFDNKRTQILAASENKKNAEDSGEEIIQKEEWLKKALEEAGLQW
jgi:hypothetical protein